VKKSYGRLCSKFCFRFGLIFKVCLVEVVVVETFFQHSCGTKPTGCGEVNHDSGRLF